MLSIAFSVFKLLVIYQFSFGFSQNQSVVDVLSVFFQDTMLWLSTFRATVRCQSRSLQVTVGKYNVLISIIKRQFDVNYAILMMGISTMGKQKGVALLQLLDSFSVDQPELIRSIS